MHLSFFAKAVLLFLFIVGGAREAAALEHTKVLPKGVRNLNLRVVDTDISNKTNGTWNALPLGSPLEKELTFKNILKDEEALRASQLRGFMLDNGMSESDVLGQFTADLKGRLQVVAPIASYGVSENLTLAVAVPYYRAKTSISVGFKQSERAAQFVAALAKAENNQTASAREAADKLNNAVGRLNDKLLSNGYQELQDWSASGVGDATLVAKYRLGEIDWFTSALMGGFVLPTGRTDDPDILSDMAFGDGQWDVFTELALDQSLSRWVYINEFSKYTLQLPGQRRVRLATADEPLEVRSENTRFKLGDKMDAGVSLNYTPPGGLTVGVGYNYFRKFGDRYQADEEAVKSNLEKDSSQESFVNEFSLGYSAVPAYQRGNIPVPFELKWSYLRQVRSKNLPVTDLTQVDASLYF